MLLEQNGFYTKMKEHENLFQKLHVQEKNILRFVSIKLCWLEKEVWMVLFILKNILEILSNITLSIF